MDEQTIDRIFAGSLVDLPPVSSKIVRIFTSSTFTDMLMERNTLMEYVYPKIKEYCREKHGLEFQVPIAFKYFFLEHPLQYFSNEMTNDLTKYTVYFDRLLI